MRALLQAFLDWLELHPYIVEREPGGPWLAGEAFRREFVWWAGHARQFQTRRAAWRAVHTMNEYGIAFESARVVPLSIYCDEPEEDLET